MLFSVCGRYYRSPLPERSFGTPITHQTQEKKRRRRGSSTTCLTGLLFDDEATKIIIRRFGLFKPCDRRPRMWRMRQLHFSFYHIREQSE